jgi:hypothetical protein
MIRATTVGAIRANGGSVEYEPEIHPALRIINIQHVNVVERGGKSIFGMAQPNPIPKRKRFGGADYREPDRLW